MRQVAAPAGASSSSFQLSPLAQNRKPIIAQWRLFSSGRERCTERAKEGCQHRDIVPGGMSKPRPLSRGAVSRAEALSEVEGASACWAVEKNAEDHRQQL